MKSKLIFCSLLALSIAFTSCKKEDENETTAESEIAQPLIVPSVQPIPTENYTQPNQQQANMPPQNMPQAVGQTAVAGQAGMNPAHGQPGHRCDIAVGASLSSPAAKPGATTVNPGKPSFTTSTVQNPAPASSGVPDLLKPNATPTAPGMNPPHGQEGHQCGIAVGAPLTKTDSQ